MHYGYSVWYIPHNYNELSKEYNIKHLPHVTYKTNIETEKECYDLAKLIPREITIEFFSDIAKFPKMHQNDPLFGYGWYVTPKNGIECMHFATEPHLTLKYFNNYNDFKSHKIIQDITPKKTKCFLAIVDTQSNNPADWFIITKYN